MIRDRKAWVGIDLEEVPPQFTALILPEDHPLGPTDVVGPLPTIDVVNVNPTHDRVGRIDRLDARLGRHLQDNLVHECEPEALGLPAGEVDLGGDHVDLLELLGLSDLSEHELVDPHVGVEGAVWCDRHAASVASEQVDAGSDPGLDGDMTVVFDAIEHLIAVRTPDDDDTPTQVDTVSVHVLEDTGLTQGLDRTQVEV